MASSNPPNTVERAVRPASLMRPYGGWLSDRLGARRVMYWALGTMLAIPALLVFGLGCAMGVGRAAVYKHIREYLPGNVGAVGGLVGMLGGLGGFLLPPPFAHTKAWSGFPSSTFFVVFVPTASCLVWMHWTVVQMLHSQSPELARHIERPDEAREEELV